MRPLVALLAAFVAALCTAGAALAAPFAVRLGEVRVALDAPPGFADTGFTGSPRLLELAEALTSASNRILLFAISDDDLRRFMVGDPLEFRRYMIAVTPRSLEHGRVGAEQFARFVADATRELGAAAPPGDLLRRLDAQPRGRMALLAELLRETERISVLQGTRLPEPERREQAPPRYLLSTTTLMRLRGKAISLSVYTIYEAPQDEAWLRDTTLRWADALLRLNERAFD